jgi:hypothetical protein
LVTHPGYHDADLDLVGSRLRASRNVEREALKTISEFPQIELVSYSSLRGD